MMRSKLGQNRRPEKGKLDSFAGELSEPAGLSREKPIQQTLFFYGSPAFSKMRNGLGDVELSDLIRFCFQQREQFGEALAQAVLAQEANLFPTDIAVLVRK